MRKKGFLFSVIGLCVIPYLFIEMGLDPIGYVLLVIFELILIVCVLRYYFPQLFFRKQFHSISFSDIDTLSGDQFEQFCAGILRQNGFKNIRVTPHSGDQGVDIVAQKDGEQYAIQCKRFSSKLGNTPVQEVNAGRSFYHCDHAVVMTSNYFTQGAVEAARACDVDLWDRDDLFAMMAAFDDD